MSVYGDILSAFPELIQEYQIFTMRPVAGSSYRTRVPLLKRRGAFIRGARSRMSIAGEMRVTNEQGTFYCYDNIPDEPLGQGLYFEDNRQIFLLIDDQTFAKEAGFAAFTCQIVKGNTDQQVENLNVEKRTITDYPI